ncbi:hypothetical protein AVEN_228578-1 [Araneus ventricosus]|uniref:Uncharacterized protein n=1 Tax=Araneus ventricosus TaxID=182803 RepID=A0A4Y2FNP5_ARAVE|nr:hypothetical protein AVEN_228578-1 [Araneus ventricosus]
MQKEEYGEWMSIDEDIPVAATLTDLEICQARPSNEENPPTNAEMRQALDILKRGVQHRSTNFKKGNTSRGRWCTLDISIPLTYADFSAICIDVWKMLYVFCTLATRGPSVPELICQGAHLNE